jgi:Tol biopolymer transport system component
VRQQLERAELRLGDFSWSPLGDAIFFEGSSRSVLDVWKISVEADSLRWIDGPDRLTASPARETDLKVTANAIKLAYTARSERVNIKLFPFNPVSGELTGKNLQINSGGMVPDTLDLSPDGGKLAFVTNRRTAEEKQLWTRSIETEETRVLSAGNYRFPRWSRDSSRLACRKATGIGTKALPLNSFQVVLINSESGEEQILNSPVIAGANNPSDWSNDGNWILLSCRSGKHSPNDVSAGVQELPPSAHICLQPLAAAPNAEEQARILVSHPDYDLWQHRFSPDDRWILFNAVERKGAKSSRLFVISFEGGEWIPITDGEYWADKARWSPDGKTIYYISNRGGFYNVWGIGFDSVEGRTVGEPNQVTYLDSPSHQIDPDLTRMEIGVSDNLLALQLMEVTGNIWVLQEVQ